MSMLADTLGRTLRDSAVRYADRTAVLVPAKGGFDTLTYQAFYQQVRARAGGLRALGLQRGDRIAIMAENSLDWSITDWACQCLGIVVATIFPTLPADQASYIVQDSASKVVFAGTDELAERLQNAGARVVQWSELAELAAQHGPLDPAEFDREIDAGKTEDLATLIYTSGTSGVPKGVMLSHRALTWVGGAVVSNLPVNQDDRFLSFLPMSHVFERVDGQILPLSLGASIAYSKSLASLANDIVRAQPTVLLVVPRFLENVKEKILDGVSKAPPIRQKLFRWALDQGTRKATGRPAPFYFLTDRLVGSKIRERLGGKVRLMASGGAALPLDVSHFFLAFGIKLLQGYGLTESSAGITINHPDRNRPHTVGEPLPGMEVRIAADGEVLLRGPALMDGYLNLPNDGSIDADGWFYTGDIGEMEGTYLKITDRKKDLLVLGNGKNVAPMPIENQLRSSRFISEAVVLGDGLDSCIALLVPNAANVRAELGLGEEVALADHPGVKKLIKGEVDRINQTLAGYERIKRHALLERPFTIESGELTPSMKVKRRVVVERYADLIAELAR